MGKVTHNMSRSAERNRWNAMIQRCYNKNHPRYKDYGGRGVKVCDRWRYDFMKYYRDLYPAPGNNLTLDRIDIDGDYKLSNMRWTTHSQQNHNRRKPINNTSGAKGVSWYKPTQRWVAHIAINKKKDNPWLFRQY